MQRGQMSRSGKAAAGQKAARRPPLTVGACDACVRHKNRQLNQYCKAELKRGHSAERAQEAAASDTLSLFCCFFFHPPPTSFSPLLFFFVRLPAATLKTRPPLFFSSLSRSLSLSARPFKRISVRPPVRPSVTKASRQLEITAPPSSKSLCHNLD